MAALSSEGFRRKTLQEIINSIKLNLRNDIPNINVGNETILNQFIGILSLELDEAWQGIEGVYSSQTLNGAEGKYLDDVLSKNGVFRSGATSANGDVVVFYDNSTIVTGTTIPSTTTMSIASRVYNIDRQYTLNNFYSAYRVPENTFEIGQTVIARAGLLGATNVNFNFTPTTEEELVSMPDRLRDYIRSQIGEQAEKVNSLGGRLLVGYASDGTLIPFLKDEVFLEIFMAGNVIGEGGKRTTFTSDSTGLITVSATEITDITPSFTGYLSTTGFQDFVQGNEAETDAEYRSAFSRSVAGGVRDSVAGITAALNRVDGVSKVRVYENPTSTDTYIVNANSVKVAVIGGSPSDIGLSLFNNIPANALFDGDTTVSITNPTTGDPETIRYETATRALFGLTISYTTRDGSDFTETERTSIATNLTQINNDVEIGEDIDAQSVIAAIYNAVNFQKITALSFTSTKSGGSSMTTGSERTGGLLTGFNELAVINTPAIVYNRS